MEISIQQSKFIDYYIESGNANEASRLAGYKVSKYGNELLTKPYIREEITKRKEELQSQSMITKLELVNTLVNIVDNTMDTAPRTTIEAIKTLNKMLGYEAPIKTELSVKQEQPLFGELPDEDIDYLEVGDGDSEGEDV